MVARTEVGSADGRPILSGACKPDSTTRPRAPSGEGQFASGPLQGRTHREKRHPPRAGRPKHPETRLRLRTDAIEHLSNRHGTSHARRQHRIFMAHVVKHQRAVLGAAE